MKTRTISFRCPEEIFEEMKQRCSDQQMERSAFIVQALQSLFSSLAEQGIGATDESAAAPDTNEA